MLSYLTFIINIIVFTLYLLNIFIYLLFIIYSATFNTESFLRMNFLQYLNFSSLYYTD